MEKEDNNGYVDGELGIAVVGKTGVGKSTTCNTICGSKQFESRSSAGSVTGECKHTSVTRFGRRLQVVDIPGFGDTKREKSNVDEEMKQSVQLLAPGINAILFLVSMTGRFTAEDKDTIHAFVNLYGKACKDYVIVVFTGGDDLEYNNSNMSNYLEDAPQSLKDFLVEVKDRYITVNNRAEDNEYFVRTLFTMIDQMVRDNNGKYYTNDMLKEAEKREQERLNEIKKKDEEKIAQIKSDARRAERKDVLCTFFLAVLGPTLVWIGIALSLGLSLLLFFEITSIICTCLFICRTVIKCVHVIRSHRSNDRASTTV